MAGTRRADERHNGARELTMIQWTAHESRSGIGQSLCRLDRPVAVHDDYALDASPRTDFLEGSLRILAERTEFDDECISGRLGQGCCAGCMPGNLDTRHTRRRASKLMSQTFADHG
jgi:hypothetical protein